MISISSDLLAASANEDQKGGIARWRLPEVFSVSVSVSTENRPMTSRPVHELPQLSH
jgi:hypothetical protein